MVPDGSQAAAVQVDSVPAFCALRLGCVCTVVNKGLTYMWPVNHCCGFTWISLQNPVGFIMQTFLFFSDLTFMRDVISVP